MTTVLRTDFFKALLTTSKATELALAWEIPLRWQFKDFFDGRAPGKNQQRFGIRFGFRFS